MAKFKERLQAQDLRREGWSVKDIAKKLDVSRGSASLWCRDIQLSKRQKQLLKQKMIQGGHRGRLLGAAKNKEDRLKRIRQAHKDAKNMLGKLNDRDKFLLGIGLYWGEGVKSDSGRAGIVNSDPHVILFAMEWFMNNFNLVREDFNPYIYISEIHRDREEKIKKYWQQLLGLERGQCDKVIFLKGRPKKIYKNHDSYYGVLALSVRRSTNLKYKIRGLIEACVSQGSSVG